MSVANGGMKKFSPFVFGKTHSDIPKPAFEKFKAISGIARR